MFSSTTTELSTSIPIPITIPPIEIVLSVIPFTYIKAKVATIDVGIEIAITNDVFGSLKITSRTIIATSAL